MEPIAMSPPAFTDEQQPHVSTSTSTSAIMTPPSSSSSSPTIADKYDEIYARYSLAINNAGGGDIHNEPPAKDYPTSGDPKYRRSHLAIGIDPPEEYDEKKKKKYPYSAASIMHHNKTTNNMMMPSSSYSSYSSPIPRTFSSQSYNSSNNNNNNKYYSPIIPLLLSSSVASRDDDATTIHEHLSSSTQWSNRSPGSPGISTVCPPPPPPMPPSSNYHRKLVGSSSSSSSHNHTNYTNRQQRDAIYSKLDELNAKSRALRGISYNTTNAAAASSHQYHSPTSVTDSNNTSSSFLGSNISISSNNHKTPYLSSLKSSKDESIDSRLEYLTKQSLAYRKNNNGNNKSSSTASSSYSKSKKVVTFESDYNIPSVGASSSMMQNNSSLSDDNKSVYTRYDDQYIPSSSATVTVTSASGINCAASVTSASSLASSTMLSNNSRAAAMQKMSSSSSSSSPLAMKILSEKILAGYTMSRNHCPDCNMTLLSNKNVTTTMTSKKQKPSFTFNADGTLNMDSLRGGSTTTSTRQQQAAEEEELVCAFCPINKVRMSLSRLVCKRVMATKLTSERLLEVDGTSLCKECSSPNLMNSAIGTVVECQVCPILNEVCIEIVREEGRRRGGGVLLMEETTSRRACMDCGCSEVMTSDGLNKCMVCQVLKMKLGDKTASAANSVFGSVSGGVVRNDASFPFSSDRSVTSSSFLGGVTSLSGQQSVYDTRSVVDTLVPPPPPQQQDSSLASVAMPETQVLTLLPDLNKSTSIKSNEDCPITITNDAGTNLAPSADNASAEPLIDIAKMQEQLNETIMKLNTAQLNSRGDSTPPPLDDTADDLATLQNQLKSELAKTKQSQAALERTLQITNETMTSKLTRDQLKTELDSTKQAQVALEKIMADTHKIEKTLSSLSNANHPTREEDINKLEEELLEESYSISQQEVDPTGHLKEYIPEPSIFRYDNIPSIVVVYQMPEEDGDPSVAASHHTKNLKRQASIQAVSNSGVFDCCGDSTAVRQQQQQQLNQHHDIDTIDTDDDIDDYTLNTVDDSRFDYNTRTSRSMAEDDDEGYQHSTVGEDKERHKKKCQPKSNTGRCIFACFDCGGADEEVEDVYTMMESSKRGIQVEEPPLPPQQHKHSNQVQHPHHDHNDLVQSTHYQEGQGDFSVGSRSNHHHQSPKHGRDAHTPPPPRPPPSSKYSVDGSDHDSMNRVSYSHNFDREQRGAILNERKQIISGSGYPTAALADWDSVADSDMSSIKRTPGSPAPNQPQPKSSTLIRPPASPSSRFSDYSVTSDLTDQSSVRRVTFGSQHSFRRQKNGRQQRLRALTEESSSDNDQTSVDISTEMRLRRLESAQGLYSVDRVTG